MFDILSKSSAFAGITADEIKSIFNSINYQIKNFTAGQIIALSEERCENLLILISGSVKGEMIDFSGKTIKIENIEAPRTVASAFLFGRNNKYPVNIVANSNVKMLLLPKDSVIKLLQSNVVILNNYLNAISNRAQFLSDKIRFLSFKTIKGKIAHYILELAKSDKTIIMPETQQDLADFFGVTRPSLARIVSEMEKEGLIDAKGKKIKILDRNGLIKLLQ